MRHGREHDRLVKLGVTHVGELCGSTSCPAQERQAGYEAARAYAQSRSVAPNTAADEEAAAHRSSEPRTSEALFVAKSLTLMAALRAAHWLGLAVPEAGALAGSDTSSGSELVGPGLTDIR